MPVDYHRCMAYVALAHEDGQLRQVGVSRYAGIPGSHNCECAVAVSEPWQRKGLGRLLLKHLIDAARRNGYHCMVSRDLANNYAMHRLTKALGFTSRYLGRCQRDPPRAGSQNLKQGPCGPWMSASGALRRDHQHAAIEPVQHPLCRTANEPANTMMVIAAHHQHVGVVVLHVQRQALGRIADAHVTVLGGDTIALGQRRNASLWAS